MNVGRDIRLKVSFPIVRYFIKAKALPLQLMEIERIVAQGVDFGIRVRKRNTIRY